MFVKFINTEFQNMTVIYNLLNYFGIISLATSHNIEIIVNSDLNCRYCNIDDRSSVIVM
jgi:hypothetical protein